MSPPPDRRERPSKPPSGVASDAHVIRAGVKAQVYALRADGDDPEQRSAHSMGSTWPTVGKPPSLERLELQKRRGRRPEGRGGPDEVPCLVGGAIENKSEKNAHNPSVTLC
jgi:hypothetical protein